MLDQIDLDRSLDKETYKAKLDEHQSKLYDLQEALYVAGRPTIIVFEGWAGTSKVGTIGLLTRHLDPRRLRVHPITPPRTYETMYPWLYRFWLKTPSRGQLTLFDRSWYRQVLAERTVEKCSSDLWRTRCEDIASFERQLADDGAIILKFWLHISKKEQSQRFKKLMSDPLTSWQVTDEDRWQNKHYERVYTAVEDLISRTDAPHAPWIVLPATNPRYARIAVFEAIEAALEPQLGYVLASAANGTNGTAHSNLVVQRTSTSDQSNNLSPYTEEEATAPPAVSATLPVPPILSKVDLSLQLDEKTYDHELAELQAKLHVLGLQVYQQHRLVILVFEGWDAAGKGGAIKRITAKLDPRGYIVHAIAAPSEEDKSHHYLYRFWRRLPPQGTIGIFDRSWYGRVLVERIEGFAHPEEWQRAYTEINEFERQLVEFNAVVCKFWLHVSPEEQLRRFEERKTVRYKSWKLTEEDWRNREKWPLYEQAVDEMLLRTSTPAAPWTVVESEDKRFSRVKILRTLVRRLEAELGKVKL